MDYTGLYIVCICTYIHIHRASAMCKMILSAVSSYTTEGLVPFVVISRTVNICNAYNKRLSLRDVLYRNSLLRTLRPVMKLRSV